MTSRLIRFICRYKPGVSIPLRFKTRVRFIISMDTSSGIKCLNAPPAAPPKLTKNQKKKLRKKNKGESAKFEVSEPDFGQTPAPNRSGLQENGAASGGEDFKSNTEATAASAVNKLSITDNSSTNNVQLEPESRTTEPESRATDQQSVTDSAQEVQPVTTPSTTPSTAPSTTYQDAFDETSVNPSNPASDVHNSTDDDKMLKGNAGREDGKFTRGGNGARGNDRHGVNHSEHEDRKNQHSGQRNRSSSRDKGQRSKHQGDPFPEKNTPRRHEESNRHENNRDRRDSNKRRHDQRDDWGRDGTRDSKAGRQDSQQSGSGSSQRQHSRERNAGRQNSHGPAQYDDPHRKLADDMKYHIRNPKIAKLDVYQGYVYASALAYAVGIQEHELIQIGKKFDSEFEVFPDDNNLVNIGLKRRRHDDPDTVLSKKLSSLLRHRAEDKGFKLLDGGFLYVRDILRRGEFKNYNEEDIKRIVRNNDKQRFKLETDQENGELKIRANQGHSMKVENLDLKTITSKDVPCCVHGTNYEAWSLIKSSGLRTMGRNHIHFAPGEPGESGVISGMRSSCQVLIFLDMDKAIADGIKFELSDNNVILSEGDKYNTIAPKYFQHVIDRKSRKSLPYSQQAQGKQEETKQDSGKKGKQGKQQQQQGKQQKGKGGQQKQQQNQQEEQGATGGTEKSSE